MAASKAEDIVKGGMKAWLHVRKQAIAAGQALGETATSLGGRVGDTAGTLGERVAGLRDRARGEQAGELTELSDTTPPDAKTDGAATAAAKPARRPAAAQPPKAASKPTPARSKAAPARSKSTPARSKSTPARSKAAPARSASSKAASPARTTGGDKVALKAEDRADNAAPNKPTAEPEQAAGSEKA